ncbi:hypothetical protein [Actinomadura sp. K4S16]|uniref:hypothetical protein n=1 Tax=Actinomadura sp. K4S16 TaxID=1316147 RepID=UPI0013592B25|nr:hypothetical protein [Actinomadura sp. K4S16]
MVATGRVLDVLIESAIRGAMASPAFDGTRDLEAAFRTLDISGSCRGAGWC